MHKHACGSGYGFCGYPWVGLRTLEKGGCRPPPPPGRGVVPGWAGTAERGDEDAMVVRKLARRLNSILAKTAKFFSVSTKRWAALRRIAMGMGFHVNHGPMRQRSRGAESKRLLKCKTVQKTRYVHWKRWAAHVWLNNLAALQMYLLTLYFPAMQKNQANDLLKHSERVSIVGGMVVYERWAAMLTTLSLATQAQWAVLPIPGGLPKNTCGSLWSQEPH